MISTVHIADLHLDSPFSGCSSAERTQRRNELRNALGTVCVYCLEKKVQLLLISGDLFDGDFVRRETVKFAADCFASIPETRVFIAPGNHDPYNSVSPYRYCSFPDNVHIFDEESPKCVEIPELSVNVYGYAFTSAKMSSDPVAGLCPRDTSRINILVGHGDLDFPSSPYYNVKISDLSASGFNYAALGHVHKPSGLMKFGRTSCAYSGCLIGRDFGECGKHGMAVLEISGEETKLKYIPVSDATYEEITVDVTDMTLSDIIEKVRRERSVMPEKSRIRVCLEGENPQIDVIYSGLLTAFDSELEEIKNNAGNGINLEDISAEFSLRGEFARKLRPYLESDDPMTVRKATLALKYGLDALKK